MSDFSKRHGFLQNPPITIWHDAPEKFRNAVISIAKTRCKKDAKWIRTAISDLLMVRIDPNRWGDEAAWQDAERLIFECPWYKVYDIAELIALRMHSESQQAPSYRRSRVVSYPAAAVVFQQSLNEVMSELGIGWEMVKGKFEIRGEPSQQALIDKAKTDLAEFPNAERRFEEAFADLSRRPTPDVEGAITHAVAALESVCKKISGLDDKSFGDVIGANRTLFPPAINSALGSMWGYSSNHARHGTEIKTPPDIHEAYLVVGVISAAIIYVTNKIQSK